MDSVDRDIVLALLTREQTIHELSKVMLKTSDQHALRAYNSFLRYRLSRLAEDGIVRRRQAVRGVYYVPVEDMILGRATLTVQRKKERLVVEIGDVLVTQRDGLHQIVVLKS